MNVLVHAVVVVCRISRTHPNLDRADTSHFEVLDLFNRLGFLFILTDLLNIHFLLNYVHLSTLDGLVLNNCLSH